MQVATEDGGCYSGRWWRPLSMCWRSVEIDGDSSFLMRYSHVMKYLIMCVTVPPTVRNQKMKSASS